MYGLDLCVMQVSDESAKLKENNRIGQDNSPDDDLYNAMMPPFDADDFESDVTGYQSDFSDATHSLASNLIPQLHSSSSASLTPHPHLHPVPPSPVSSPHMSHPLEPSHQMLPPQMPPTRISPPQMPPFQMSPPQMPPPHWTAQNPLNVLRQGSPMQYQQYQHMVSC